jgi:hypothetical protein
MRVNLVMENDVIGEPDDHDPYHDSLWCGWRWICSHVIFTLASSMCSAREHIYRL